MATAMKAFILSFFQNFFTNWLEDFFIVVGIGLIIVNTYLITVISWNALAGNYLLGVTLIVIGLVLAKR